MPRGTVAPGGGGSERAGPFSAASARDAVRGRARPGGTGRARSLVPSKAGRWPGNDQTFALGRVGKPPESGRSW
jgi:hypothetical protein